jgi:hypothetical protein
MLSEDCAAIFVFSRLGEYEPPLFGDHEEQQAINQSQQLTIKGWRGQATCRDLLAKMVALLITEKCIA